MILEVTCYENSYVCFLLFIVPVGVLTFFGVSLYRYLHGRLPNTKKDKKLSIQDKFEIVS